MVLGYSQVSWDNESGEEQQPVTQFLSWAALTDDEKAAGTLLGYNATRWDNVSRSEAEPAVVDKSWSELTSCADGECACMDVYCVLVSSFRDNLDIGHAVNSVCCVGREIVIYRETTKSMTHN